MTDLSEAKAALERGRPVVLICAPAVERAGAVWELLGHSPGVTPPGVPGLAPGVSETAHGPAASGQVPARTGPPVTPGHGPGVSPPGPVTVIICADAVAAAEWVATAPAGLCVHAVTGLTRTTALLKAGAVTVLAGAPKDLAALVVRSALKLDTIETVVLAWPEALVAGEHASTLDTLLAEAPAARRIVLSWNPSALGDFLERHARRAEVVGELPVDAEGRPLSPIGPSRYAIVSPQRRVAAVADMLDTLNPKRPIVWHGDSIPSPDSHDVVLCTALPTRNELVALSRLGPLVVLISPAQLPYLRSIAAPLTAHPLPSAADRAQDRAEALRAEVVERLERGDVDAEVALLGPLFERFDPAEVAGALLALQRVAGSGKREAAPPVPAPAPWVKVFVTVGKKDRASAKDLVGALIKEVGLTKEQIGRIDVRETHCLVDVAGAVVDRAVKGLTGVSIRGRRVVARVGREG